MASSRPPRGAQVVLSSDGEQTDGGTAWAPDQSDWVTEQVTRGEIDGYQLQHSSLIWGSVSLTIGSKIISDLELHGHRMNTGGTGFGSLVDHGAGRLRDPQGMLQALAVAEGVARISVRYRHATSDKRWVRQIEHRTASLKWWGASDGDEVRDLLCWALTACSRLGLVQLRLDGSYRYRGTIEIPDGVELTDGRLTVTDSDVFAPLRLDYEREVISWLGGEWPLIIVADAAVSAGFRRLELDGNCTGSLGPWETPEEYDVETVDNWLRNTPICNGLAVTNHGGREVSPDLSVVIEDCHVHDYHGNCALGHSSARFDTRNLRIGKSLRNHLLYNLNGIHSGLQFYGFWWWGAAVIERATIHGLDVNALEAHPLAEEAHLSVINYRGVDHGDGSAVTSPDRLCAIYGLSANLSGDGFVIGRLADALGAGFTLSGASIIAPNTGRLALIRRTGNGPTGLDEQWTLEGISVFEQGHKVSLQANGTDLLATNFGARNISIKKLRGSTDQEEYGPPLMQIMAGAGTDPRFGAPQKILLESVLDSTPRLFLFALQVTEGAVGIDVTVRDCEFHLASNTIFMAPNGQGTTASLPDAPALIRVHFERCLFAIDPELPYEQNLGLFLTCSTFRECYAFWGGVREPVAERWPSATIA